MPTYANPPIVEAAIEIRFAEQLSADEVESCAKKLGKQLPVREDLLLHHIQLRIDGETPEKIFQTPAPTDRKKIKLTHSDADRSVMIGDRSFVAARLPPYTNFEDLLEFLRNAWDIYYSVAGFRKISRIGLRYINRLDIPFIDGKIDHSDYLKLLIDIPKEFENITNYNLAFDHLSKEVGGIVKVQSSSAEAALIDHVSFFLDIDVIALEEVPQKYSGIEERLQRMRDLKNRMFESFITDKARQMFHG